MKTDTLIRWQRGCVLVLAVLLSGCASAPDLLHVYRKGKIAPDAYLATVIELRTGCAPYGAACVIGSPNGATLILPPAGQTPQGCMSFWLRKCATWWPPSKHAPQTRAIKKTAG
jgi:hypothetical protein